MADTLGDRLRSLLASDVYSSQGRLRADDLLVRNGWAGAPARRPHGCAN